MWRCSSFASRRKSSASLRFCRRNLATNSSANTSGRGTLFHFMGIPPSPALAVPQLQKKYHEMQWKCHPDQQQQRQQEQQQAVPPATEAQREKDGEKNVLSTDDSVYANIAYETLKDPFLRCKYLLKLVMTECRLKRPLTLAEAEQVHLDDQDEQLFKGSSSDGTTTEPLLAPYIVPPEFLAEMMELNEEVFELDLSGSENRDRMIALLEEVKRRDAEFFADAVAAWEAQDYMRLKATVLRWTYISNLKKHIVNRLP